MTLRSCIALKLFTRSTRTRLPETNTNRGNKIHVEQEHDVERT
jgi:hypothetical protein